MNLEQEQDEEQGQQQEQAKKKQKWGQKEIRPGSRVTQSRASGEERYLSY